MRVLARTPAGYAMEELEPVARRGDLPALLVAHLRTAVWTRGDLLGASGVDTAGWRGGMRDVFGVEVPEWVSREVAASSCAHHGDPTFSNLMRGPATGAPVLIDPCHRPYVPEHWSVDAGKVVQSCLGWETVQAGWDPQPWALGSDPLWDDERSLRLVLFFAGYHLHRIVRREASAGRRRDVMDWAERGRGECWRACGYEG